MPKPDILVVSIDGLRASSLGAYGNTAFGTPSLDEFAAQSFLLDSCYAPAVDLPGIYRSLWQSLHPLRPRANGAQVDDLPSFFASRGYVTSIITDEAELAASSAGQFHEIIEGGAAADPSVPSARALELTETSIARLFLAACESLLSEKRTPRLIWLHSTGMYGPWDAPLEMQQSLREEGDPPPLESAVPPDAAISGADDPDAVFQHSCAYAAQVMVLDECWKVLQSSVDSVHSDDGWLVMLIGTRGFPLGEHGRIGGVDPRLYGEQLHVPWLVCFPNGLGRLGRSAALTSHLDLFPTAAAGLDEARFQSLASVDGMDVSPLARSARAEWHYALLSVSATSYSLRTSGWCLRKDVPSGSIEPASSTGLPGGELFVRPDDRWEANDVAKLCTEELESLSQAVDRAEQSLLRNEPVRTNVS